MVFAGEFWSGASGAGLSHGFRALGWAVQEIDYGNYGARSGRHLAMKVANRLTRPMANIAYRTALIDACEVQRPKILLTIKGSAIDSDLLQKVKRLGAKTVMYYPDVHFDHPGVSQGSFKDYDLFVTTKTFQMEQLEQRLGRGAVAYVPHGYSDMVHQPILGSLSDGDYFAEALHIGNYSSYKQAWLEALIRLRPELDLHIAGSPVWRAKVARSALQPAAIHGERMGVAYAMSIQSAKINIAVHFGPTSYGWQDNVSTRTFEIPACKGFMLHIDNDEVREFFEPGRDIDVFSSPEELSDKVEFYLARPDLRATMIEHAYERCVPAYGYGARAAAMARLFEERL